MRGIVLVLAAVLGAASAAAQDHPPVAPVRPVTDDYFGTKVVDPYRWMEDRSAPEFVSYMMAQGAYARGVLDRIPGRDRLQQRVASHTGGGVIVTRVQIAGDRIFLMKRAPEENTFKLYVRDSAAAPERLLVDPDRDAAPGHHFAIDYYQPSQDGQKLAYGISPGGSEHSVIHIIDVATGKESPETIDRAENGAPSWLPDGTGFFYNRMVALKPGEPDTARYLNSRVYLHRLGRDPDKDVPLIGTNVAGSPAVTPVDDPAIAVLPGTDKVFAEISHGSEPAVELLIAPLSEAMRPGAHWRKFADTPDGVIEAELDGNTIYLLTHKDAPRYKIVALDAASLDWAHAKTIVAPGTRVIEDMSRAADGLYIPISTAASIACAAMTLRRAHSPT